MKKMSVPKPKSYRNLKERADDICRKPIVGSSGQLDFEFQFLISQMAEEIDYLKKRIDQLERSKS